MSPECPVRGWCLFWRARLGERESSSVCTTPLPATPHPLHPLAFFAGKWTATLASAQLQALAVPFRRRPPFRLLSRHPCPCRMGSSFSPTPAPTAPSPLNPGWSPATNQNTNNQQASVARSTSAGSYSNSEESSEGARARRSGGAAGEWTGGSSGVLDGLARGEIGSAYGASLLSLFERVSSTVGS